MIATRLRLLIEPILLIALAFVLSGCTRAPLTVEDVIERNTRAVGGRMAIEAVKSIQVILHIVDPGFEVDGDYRAVRPGRMRIDVKAGGKPVYIEAFNGERAWQWKGEGEPVDESPAATAALRHGVELPGKLFGLHEMRQRGHRIELAGRENVDGANYFVLRLTFSDGYSTSLYVDPNSWLIKRRRDVRALHPDIDPTPTTIEQRLSDYRQVAGVRFSFASEEIDLKTGKVIETTRVKEIRVNPQLDPAIFDKL